MLTVSKHVLCPHCTVRRQRHVSVGPLVPVAAPMVPSRASDRAWARLMRREWICP